MKTVLLIGTLDTKGPEIAYVRDRLHALGLGTIVADSGILSGPLDFVPDVSRAEVARLGGRTLDTLRHAGSRGEAVHGMLAGLQRLALELYREGKLDGVITLGGAEGAVLGASAALALPIGIPKIIVTPLASGQRRFGPLVGTRDVMVVHSVVDILGLNPIACTVFDNVAAALKGLIECGRRGLPEPEASSKYVAVTMLGNTTKAVMRLKDRLAEHGYEAVIFHSNGVGGPAMEELAEAGQFLGVIDYTTNEVNDPLVGGIHDGGPDRLRRVGQVGLPQVVVPACIDFSVFHAGAIPSRLAGRPVYDHNPEYTLVRTSPDEMLEIARIFGERLGSANGPVVLAVPLCGLSIPNVPGGPFWDPESDATFLHTLRDVLGSRFPIHTYELHANDPRFGEQVADLFVQLLDQEKK
jgi:uncharacterized protein (UPF0261 family)